MSDNAPNQGGAAPTAWLRVAMPYPGYADAVVADLSRIVATPSGRALLEQVRATGRSVLVECPRVLDPPNATVRPHNLRAAAAFGAPSGESDAGGPVGGTGHGSDYTIEYEPKQWPNPIHPPELNSDAMLFALLGQALVLVQDVVDPRREESNTPAIDEAAVVRYRAERGDV